MLTVSVEEMCGRVQRRLREHGLSAQREQLASGRTRVTITSQCHPSRSAAMEVDGVEAFWLHLSDYRTVDFDYEAGGQYVILDSQADAAAAYVCGDADLSPGAGGRMVLRWDGDIRVFDRLDPAAVG